MEHLDPHQRPPDSIKHVYKKYQKMKLRDLDQDPDIVNLPKSLYTSAKDKVRIVEEWSGDDLTAAFRAFGGQDEQTYPGLPAKIPVYEHGDMPGKADELPCHLLSLFRRMSPLCLFSCLCPLSPVCHLSGPSRSSDI